MNRQGILAWAAVWALCVASFDARAEVSSTPASQPMGKTHTIARGDLTVTVDGDATFEAVDPFELRVRPKAYAGDLTVVSAAENGATVKKGAPLLRLDATNVARDVAAAENDLTLAKANYRKAEEDVRLGAAADKVALDGARQALADARTNVEWFQSTDGPNAIKMADLQLKEFKDGIGDQEDELDQLRKMYKTEELTSATADIVIKRAVRRFERTKEQLPIAEAGNRKVKEVANAQARFTAESAVAKAQVGLDQLVVAQEQGKVARQAALVAAQIAAARAEQKLADVKADAAQFGVDAPTDGVVLYGGPAAGQWQGNNPRTLRPGEKTTPQQVLMTVYEPGKLRAVLVVPEGKLASVRVGLEARVSPKLLPGEAYAGRVSAVSPLPAARGGVSGYEVSVDFAGADPRLAPAMTAKVEVAAERAQGVLLCPNGAVKDGKVTVRSGGKDVERAVTVGRSDGTMTEVVKGLAEGDVVVVK